MPKTYRVVRALLLAVKVLLASSSPMKEIKKATKLMELKHRKISKTN